MDLKNSKGISISMSSYIGTNVVKGVDYVVNLYIQNILYIDNFKKYGDGIKILCHGFEKQ